MGIDSHNKIVSGIRPCVAWAALALLLLAGCHDWPDERVTAIEAQSILRQLAEIEPVQEPNIPIPEIYTMPPTKTRQIVGGAEEWKLFYFARYHTAVKLERIIREQFSSRIFDAKGEKSQVVPNFTVTANPSTNQVIARALSEQDIDAILEVIEHIDVPPIQVRIDCMISEMYADLTVDRETTILIENLFGEGTIGGKVDAKGNLMPAFPGAALRDPARERFGLKIGISRGDVGHRFNALLDILVSRGYLKILMNPSLQVVNGESAHIQAKSRVPIQQITVRSGFGDTAILETKTEYYDIIDSLRITPHVFADGYIGLETEARISAHMTPEGVKQTPIVTERTITNKDNRIRHGESLIIGGMRKSEKRDVVRGVPILKDIPLLGLLFSGRDFEERAKDVIFIITPTISSGGVPNQEVVEMLRMRHQSPMTQALHEKVLDPLAMRARHDEQRQLEVDQAELQEARQARIAAAREQMQQINQRVEALEAELEQARAEARKAAGTQEAPEEEAEAQPDAPAQDQNKADEPKDEAREPGQPAPPAQGDAANPPAQNPN
jgi:Flp pilus assembly secretin CpaC